MEMDMLFGLLGMLGFIVGIIMFIVACIKKSKKRISGFVVLGSLILFIIGLSIPSSESNESITVSPTATAVAEETAKPVEETNIAKSEVSTNNTENTNVSTDETAPSENDSSSYTFNGITVYNLQAESGAFGQRLTGLAKNNTDNMVSAYIKFVFYDTNNIQLDTAECPISNFAAGGTAKVSLPSLYIPDGAAKYEIIDIEVYSN